MARPWMPLYVADYLADTAHLNAAEHGAYLLLIMHYWRAGGLPTDDEQLRRISRMTARQWSSSRDLLRSLFGDQWRHKRIDHELAQAIEKSRTNSANAMRRHHGRSQSAVRSDTQSQPQSQSERKEEKKDISALRASSDWPSDYQDQFWRAYPRKVGKKAAFRKLELVKRSGEITFTALLAAVRKIHADEPRFIPHPTTWLNRGSYLDGEPSASSTGPPEWLSAEQRRDWEGGWRPGMPTRQEIQNGKAGHEASGTDGGGTRGAGDEGDLRSEDAPFYHEPRH